MIPSLCPFRIRITGLLFKYSILLQVEEGPLHQVQPRGLDRQPDKMEPPWTPLLPLPPLRARWEPKLSKITYFDPFLSRARCSLSLERDQLVKGLPNA